MAIANVHPFWIVSLAGHHGGSRATNVPVLALNPFPRCLWPKTRNILHSVFCHASPFSYNTSSLLLHYCRCHHILLFHTKSHQHIHSLPNLNFLSILEYLKKALCWTQTHACSLLLMAIHREVIDCFSPRFQTTVVSIKRHTIKHINKYP
ncbi:hypothetical protein BDB00DRAFT_601970 [Zychaea mexicana]|uniref:uncharacterized protein n=1 Tax=Zychaea mexicana TaxID=64656 RepID=UPI0022FDBFAA|nr:uncharacterized protein BDB00DRAFT_601970 [Zychaea mexicana]KAI9489660.1 hypothetical protein BDB00DRAFT_601970 [Zychaea mexicana]